MKIAKTLILGGLLLSSASICSAQAPEANPQKWTLQACVEYAMQHNLQLKQSELTTQTNRNNLQQSKANMLPSLNGTASHSYNLGRSIDPFTNSVVQNQTVQSNSFGMGLNMNLFSGLQTQNMIERNKLTVKASELDIETNKNTISLQVVNAYTQILFTQELLSNAKVQLETTKLQVSRTEKLVNAGSLPQTNLLDLKSQLASDELNVVNNENQLEMAKLNLLQLLQKPATEAIEIVVPNLDAPQTALQRNAQQIYEAAEQLQPQIKAAELRVKSAERSIALAKGGYMPSLSLSAGIFTNYSSIAKRFVADGSLIEYPTGAYWRDANNNPIPVYQSTKGGSIEKFAYFKQLDNNLRENLAFNLNIPIFSNLQNKTNVANAIIGKESARYSAETTKNSLRQTIEQAYLDAKLAAKRYATTQKQVDALKESFRATEQRFNVGVLNSVDYNLAKNNLNRAETDLIRTKYDYIFKVKVLDFYEGKPLNF